MTADSPSLLQATQMLHVSQLKSFPATSLAVLATIVLLVMLGNRLLNESKMPPGPKGVPRAFGGNRHQIPDSKAWKMFARLNKQYGPIVSLFSGFTPVIVLGTARAATDLMDKRSDIYSSRPRFVVGNEILQDSHSGLMAPYGEYWRKWRKALHQGLNVRKCESYKDSQDYESKILIHDLVHQPKQFERHLRRFSGSIAVMLSYGRRLATLDDHIVQESQHIQDYFHSVNLPGKFLVESWTWLLYLPRSLQWFRRGPDREREREVKLHTHLQTSVVQKMNNGTIKDCLSSQMLSGKEKIGMTDLQIAYTAAAPFGAGIETSTGTVLIFLLAMLHYPDIYKKLQAEIDSVVGSGRMPDFSDIDKLPYLAAVISEVLRWRPVAPLGGTPHKVIQEDWYNGYYIPKGATVYGNLYGILKDPEVFPDPERFIPERFINPQDPLLQKWELPFGYGRRICPGMHLARNTVFISLSRIIWSFNVKPAIGPDGKEILPDPDAFTDGFNSIPLPFECRLELRDPAKGKIIEEEWEDAEAKLSVWQDE